MTDSGGGIGMSQDEQGLNPHHTHFLLVDNGRRNVSSGTPEFRAALEQKIKETCEL
jgi:L-lactate utilization protein LutB